MGRIVYVVARNHPLLRGYLTAKVGLRTADGDTVEVKLDERREDRRHQQREFSLPERRRRERRLQPSLDTELQSRGYARVFQPEPRTAPAGPIQAVGWRRRSTWLERSARTWRKLGPAIALGVFVSVGAVALWLLREPMFTAGAVLRSLLWGLIALLVWGMAWSWWRQQDLSRSRRRRRE